MTRLPLIPRDFPRRAPMRWVDWIAALALVATLIIIGD